MTNLPDPADTASPKDVLTGALYAGAGNDKRVIAAVGLLCDVPGAIYAQPGFAPYLIHIDGDKVTVDWSALGAALLSGADPTPLIRADRALLLIAASIAGGPAVHLHALLAQLGPKQRGHVMAAFHMITGAW